MKLVLVLGTRFGGGADVGVAIPIKLGAGAASTGVDFGWAAGTLPPLTRSGATSTFSSFSGAADLAGSAVDELKLFSGFAALCEALSLGADSESSVSLVGAKVEDAVVSPRAAEVAVTGDGVAWATLGVAACGLTGADC